MQETWIQFMGWEYLLEKEMATHSSILPGESHGRKSLAGYNPCNYKRVRHDLATKHTHTTWLFGHICFPAIFNLIVSRLVVLDRELQPSTHLSGFCEAPEPFPFVERGIPGRKLWSRSHKNLGHKRHHWQSVASPGSILPEPIPIGSYALG